MWFSSQLAVGHTNRAGGDHPEPHRMRSGAPPSGVVARTAGSGLSRRMPAVAHDCGRTRKQPADDLLPLVGSRLIAPIPTFTAHRFVSGIHCNPGRPWEALRRVGPSDRVNNRAETQRQPQGTSNR